MKKYINSLNIGYLLLLILAIISNPVQAQQTEQQSTITTDFLIYFPPGYNADTVRKWPMMIYLHGAGLKDRSTEGLKGDYMPWQLDHNKVLPFIVVSPVCKTNGWNVTILNFLLDDILHKFRADEDRVYLTGHSMGGFGTWDWAGENPERFAAIVPVSGCSSTGDSITAWKLRNMPVWVFHGDSDKIVDIQCNIDMVNQLKKFSQKVKFTIYPGRGHDTWEQTYSNEEMFKWLAGQDRKKNIAPLIILDEETYRSYSGKYLIGKDTITLGYDGEQMFAVSPGGDRINLRTESETLFSFEESPSYGIIFQKQKGKITGFTVMGNARQTARRIDKN